MTRFPEFSCDAAYHTKRLYKVSYKDLRTFILSATALLISCVTAVARVGGAGGRSSHSGSSHSGSSHSGGGFSGGGYSSGGGNFSIGGLLITIVIIIILVMVFSYLGRKFKSVPGMENMFSEDGPSMPDGNRSLPLPAGLDQQKIAQSFTAIQDAWQRKDLKDVRKWISDGVYQRLTAQFKMMNALGQRNMLSNIRIYGIAADNMSSDGNYQTADVAISFSMDDSFSSDKYPQFNESYPADEDTEYWTFIRRNDAPGDKNLYDNSNCPNCGALFEQKMGEISRCANCGTLTNSAAYDWVLSEITQADDYSGGAGLANDSALRTLMAKDPFFSVQRVEDIASNVFMQIMQVFNGDKADKLSRFADEVTAENIMEQKRKLGDFLFDRLYLNFVTLTSYDTAGALVNLHFQLAATYRRLVVGQKIRMLDNDFVTRNFSLTLTRKTEIAARPSYGETVYSYECSNCGAPYTDTTLDKCAYCGAPVIDTDRNWVLTQFVWA